MWEFWQVTSPKPKSQICANITIQNVKGKWCAPLQISYFFFQIIKQILILDKDDLRIYKMQFPKKLSKPDQSCIISPCEVMNKIQLTFFSPFEIPNLGLIRTLLAESRTRLTTGSKLKELKNQSSPNQKQIHKPLNFLAAETIFHLMSWMTLSFVSKCC